MHGDFGQFKTINQTRESMNKSLMSSSNVDRISKLSERLHNIQSSLETDKQFKFESLEVKFKAIQEKFK